MKQYYNDCCTKMNIRDIAHKAGVSPATVSRAFKNSNLITPETKERILNIAKESEYYPDTNISGAKKEQNKTFGILIPKEEKERLIYQARSFYSSVFNGFKEAVDQYNGRILTISYSNNAIEKAIDHLNWRELQALAIIHTTYKDNEYIEKNVNFFKAPFVVLNRKFSEKSMINYIWIDEELGGYKAATYLNNLGHKKIGCLALWQDLPYLHERLKGYKEAMAEINNFDIDKLIVHCSQPEDSYGSCKKLLEQAKGISAVFLTEEELAPGVFTALEEYNKRVPEDISIMAYNDYDFSLRSTPQLSTIRSPARKTGYLAGIVLQSIEKADIQGVFRVVLEPRLIERKSCKKI